MTSYRDAHVDIDAILEDIRSIAAIESPTSHPAGVNGVLDIIAGWFEGTDATLERYKIDDRFGDILKIRAGVILFRSDTATRPGVGAVASDPEDQTPARGVLVLSHVDTVHPVGTLAGPLRFRRDGDKFYAPASTT